MTLDEKCFRKMGWTLKTGGTNLGLYDPDGIYYGEPVPHISSVWEVCAKFLVAFMREGSWKYCVQNHDKEGSWKIYFVWWRSDDLAAWHKAEIKNDNLAEAACKAFLEVTL